MKGKDRKESINTLIKAKRPNFPNVIRKIQIVPTKYGPNIKLRSLNALVLSPPFIVHHLNGIDKKLTISTKNEANVATGVYFLTHLSA